MSLNTQKIILQAKDVLKTFPGVVALDHIDLDIHAGQVNAIVGENGAGKSTLIKIFSGIYRDFEGSVLLDGEPVTFRDTRDAQEKGIAVIHQELNLISGLSVAENIFLGREYVNSFGMIDYRRLHEETAGLLCRLDPDITPSAPVAELRVGQQQIVEIAKALSLDARIIIMDEPTSAISEKEIDVLFDLIRVLKEKGVTIIYITHKLDELDKIADRITVLRDGRYIDSAAMDSVTHEDIIRMMVGRDLEELFEKKQTAVREEVLRVENMSVPHPVREDDFLVEDVSFSLKKGEILGIFGLMGAGRTELCDAIFGIHPKRAHGRILVDGSPVRVRCPADAIAAGIGYIPEDRKEGGLVLGMNISENISMTCIERIEYLGFLNKRREKSLAESYIKQLNVKTTGPDFIVEKLSGGNQQKIVIAKWLASNPAVLLLDEPTRGIDIGAKKEIYDLINKLALQGLGIVMVSSELPEILAISDRIITMSEGKVSGEFSPEQATEEVLLHAALPRHKNLEQDETCLKT
jgi:ribose transport system ATP-binding protein